MVGAGTAPAATGWPGQQRLLEPGVVLVATIRRDGTPRLSPVEPFIMDGDLWLYVTQWPPGREYVRRGTTPTSLGQPEPRTDILVPAD